MFKSYIWSIPTRVFHWLFVLFIVIAYITAEEDRLLNYHAVIGYAIIILLFFRVVWGYFGPRYSKFSDFSLGINNVKEFLVNIFNKEQKYVGHNPMASYVMIAMLVVCFITIITGILAFGIQEGKGLFSFLNNSFFKEMELFEEIHEFFSSLFIALIVAHVSGIVADRILHKKHETIRSIFTGYKVTNNQENITLNIYQKVFSLLMLIIFISFLIFNIAKPNNVLLTSKYEPIDYKVQNELFVEECASCHILYPPQFLPKQSWALLMNDLVNHFGDDASLEEVSKNAILSFLENNSAETSTKEASVKILDSIKNKDIIAITKSSFWEKVHKPLPEKIFKHVEIKSKANCKACHIDVEKGLVEDENIKNITTFM